MTEGQRFFVRDDDIGELTDALRDFVRVFVHNSIPVSYQIIPHRLTTECAEYLMHMADLHPKYIEFGQHGLCHEMIKGNRRLKREFGPERSYDDQANDIKSGLAILRSHFGNRIEVFTPPQHKFDANTVRAVAAAGHRVFSAASYSALHHRLAYLAGRYLGLSSIRHHGISYHGETRPEADIVELSIAVAIDNGKRLILSSANIDRAVLAASKYSKIIGFMFHHELYNSVARRQRLYSIVKKLASYGASSFDCFSGLVQDRVLPKSSSGPLKKHS